MQERKKLEILQLKKDYEKDIPVVKGVSFDVYEGEFLSILGASGCGKTTLLRMLMGVLEPTSGKILKHPGLSNFLTKQIKLDGVIQGCGVLKMDTDFHVITAGQNPPNPAELLNSSRMAAMMRYLRTCYDYIILDLPPVGEVSDAMVVDKEVDGVLLVVSKDYCNRQVLAHTVRQFEFIKAKILGVVCNYASAGDENSVYAKVYSQEARKNRRS